MDMVSEFLEGCREAYVEGGDWALMQAIAVCARESIPLPKWAAVSFIVAYEKARVGDAKSWDDVLGTPYPKGANLNAQRKRQRLMSAVYDRIRDTLNAEPETPIDTHLFARVGKEFHIGKTLASEYYYAVEKILLNRR